MGYSFAHFNINVPSGEALKAAELFLKELKARTSLPCKINSADTDFNFIFKTDETLEDKDRYLIEQNGNSLSFCAKTIRGLIFAYSHFLRKSVFKNGTAELTENIDGLYIPQKSIRGHQAGYRTTPNTYDAWDYEQFFRYFLDMMAFGANICEQNGTKPKNKPQNTLMKYEQYDHLAEVSRLADTIDLDISIWHANEDDETEEEALKLREDLYSKVPRINTVFPPGGDPGELPADVFIDRCIKIKRMVQKIHPEALMHPSAQAPRKYRDWGEVLVKELSALPDEIDAIIMGPNHAFTMHELRKRIPEKYPIRFYPDLTHNLRCEYPVNFLEDDWHYTYAATLSRESVNPRPTELRTLHKLFSPYSIGSVGYSEGVHDDVNKMVWSALEFNANTDLKEILLDYARFFMYGADEEKIADSILMLERNWQGAPEENPSIDVSYNNFCELKRHYPHLCENWRFTELYFRACCDKLVKERRVFELGLCKKATRALADALKENPLQITDSIKNATEILETPFSESYMNLRGEIDELAAKLFELIGLQLDVEHYCADSWERGATLETIDNNVTDRAYLKTKLNYAVTLDAESSADYIDRLINCRKANPNEIYYSVALHGLNTLGVRQEGEFYMDIQADKPHAKKLSMPMGMAKVFDHFSFKAHFGGFLPETDYLLRVTYQTDINPEITQHKITANGTTIYEGKQYGGEKDPIFDKEFLVEGFESAVYKLPASVFVNGALELEISEPIDGFKFCELWITKA